MILVQENLRFIQKADLDGSKIAQLKYHIVGRVSLLATSLFLAVETVSRAVVASFSVMAYLATCGCCGNAREFAVTQIVLAEIAGHFSVDCFLSIFSPRGLEARLLKGPIGGIIREIRMRQGAELIQNKLAKELRLAQAQMDREADKSFQYREGYSGAVEREEVGGLDVGVCHYQGLRPTMEDEHIAKSFTVRVGERDYPVQLFGVFDGHGGPEASRYLKEKLQGKLAKLLVELNPDGLSDTGIWNALKLTFVQLNQEFTHASAGSTATVTMILDGKLWTANVGDSRTILDSNGQTIQLSEDAKPGDERYQRGIVNRGGFVDWNRGMRVNGFLAIARSVGDHHLNRAVSARPKITARAMSDIAPGSQLVLCCDGVYDVASSRQVGSAVRDHRDVGVDDLAKNIVYSALLAGSTDNLSAVVIRFP